MGEPKHAALGAAGRARVETEFDEQIVIRRYLETVEQIRQGRGR